MRRDVLGAVVVLAMMGHTGCSVAPSSPVSTTAPLSPRADTATPWPAATAVTAPQPTLTATIIPQPTTMPTAQPTPYPSPTVLASSTVPPRPSQPPTTAPSPTASPSPSQTPHPTATSIPTAQPPQVRQVSLMIPTYQFADGLHRTLPTDPIYPYERLDFSRVGPPQPQTYQALVLENDWVSLTIVPELGGRVLRWVNKATGDTPFYANPVFKPTHWGYRGWWFATGGMEWAFPTEEHGLVEWEPWGYRIRQESTRTTVAVTDQDEHTGLELEVEIGLETDSSAVYITPRIRNPLEQGRSYEFWINAMIALTDNWASEQLEFVLPTEEVTVHSTGDTGLPPPQQPLPWPIYQGRDLSYYRNWRAYMGIFAYPQAQAGFMGAYDHSSDRGIIRIFPASIVRGAKVFGGKDLDPLLWADDKSTYVELWGGVLPRFGETAILGPGEALTWTEVWYTVREMGGFAYADEKAALRLEVGPDLVTVGVASIRSFQGKLVLRQDGREVAHWPLALQPGRGVVRTWHRLGSDEARWDLQLLDLGGQGVASWRLTTD